MQRQPAVDPAAPLVVGVAGGTGSGKTTIAQLLQARLHPLTVTVIGQDQFFKPAAELPHFFSEYHRAPYPDFNRPDSFRLAALLAACTAVSGCDVLIVEGILVLYYPELRRLMQVKCYVDVALEEMLIRRTERNLAAGYGGPYAEIAHYNVECVAPQHRRYNLPQRQYADLIIPNDLHQADERDAVLAGLSEQILQAVGK